MSGVIEKFSDRARRMFARRHGRDFRDGVMAAAALIALADGDASIEEGAEVSRLLRVLDALQDQNPAVGVERYLHFVHTIRREADGAEIARKTVYDAADDEETAALIIGVCHAISEADGVVRPSETAEIEKLARLLDVKTNQAEALMFSENGAETDK